MPPPPAARRVLLAPPVNHHTPVAVHNSSHPAPSSRGAPPTACRDDSTLQSLHNAVTAPCSRHQHQNTALRRAAAFLSAAALLALAIPHQRGRPPPSAAKRPNPVPFSYPGVNQETTAPRPPVNHHQPSSSRGTRNAAKRPSLYPPPPRHPFLLPPGKPPRPRPVFPGLRPSTRSNANHRPRSPSHPPHPANFPTSQQVEKPESRKVGKLASTPPPAAGPGRGEQRSTPPHPTPPSSTGTHRVTFTLHHTYPFPSLLLPRGKPRNHLLHPASCACLLASATTQQQGSATP